MENDYESLVRPVERRLIRSIWRVVQHPDDADDALQDALQRIWSRRTEVARHPNPQALILRIGVNAAHDVLRRRMRRNHDGSLETVAADPRDAAPNACEYVELAESRKEVLAALARLPDQQAEAVLMRFANEQSYTEIAQALGCSESSARTHVERGRAKLRRTLNHLNRSRGPQ